MGLEDWWRWISLCVFAVGLFLICIAFLIAAFRDKEVNLTLIILGSVVGVIGLLSSIVCEIYRLVT